MSDKLWQILGLLTATGFVLMALFLVWVWIESELHARRLRKMQEETDAKRDAMGPLEAGYRESVKRYHLRLLDDEDQVKRAQFLKRGPTPRMPKGTTGATEKEKTW